MSRWSEEQSWEACLAGNCGKAGKREYTMRERKDWLQGGLAGSFGRWESGARAN